MSKMVVGVIGAGRIGKVHTQSILNFIPDVKVKYVADIFEGSREWVDKLGDVTFTNDVGRIFSDAEVKAVLICSSTDTHVKYIIEAAKAKKHIFCEKPVDHDIGRILEAKQAIEDNGIKFQIGFNRRFDHNFRKVKQVIDDGQVGKIYFINITSRDPDAPPISYVKVSGGMFMDMTIHDFDMARFLAGSEVKEVYAKGAVFVNPEIGAAGDIDSAVKFGMNSFAGPFAMAAGMQPAQISDALNFLVERFGLSIFKPEPEIVDGSFKTFGK